jgi:hypothetical protein
MDSTDKMAREAVVKLRENISAAVQGVVSDFCDTNLSSPLERLYIAISMAYEDKVAETMQPLIYWKSTAGETGGNDDSDGLTFGSHMRVYLNCSDLYLAVGRGLLGNDSESSSDTSDETKEENP